MTLQATNARIFGGEGDSISLAPLGTILPTGLNDPLNGAFDDVGWLHSDGVEEELSGSKTKHRGHQGQLVVRTRMEEPGTEHTFHALESKAMTQRMRYAEKAVSTAGGVRATTRGAGQRVTAVAAVIEFFDADDATIKERMAIPRYEVTPDGNRKFAGTDISGFPFRGEIIGDYYHWANSPQLKTSWAVTITGGPTGGTYTLLVNGFATAPIAYNASAAAIAAALNAISGVTGVSGVTVSGSGPFTVTFPQTVQLGSSSALTGGTGAVAIAS